MTASLSEQIIHSHIIFEAWEGYRIVLLVYFPGFYCFCYISSAQSCGEGFSWGCGSAVPSPGDAGPAPATRGPQSRAQPLCPPPRGITLHLTRSDQVLGHGILMP